MRPQVTEGPVPSRYELRGTFLWNRQIAGWSAPTTLRRTVGRCATVCETAADVMVAVSMSLPLRNPQPRGRDTSRAGLRQPRGGHHEEIPHAHTLPRRARCRRGDPVLEGRGWRNGSLVPAQDTEVLGPTQAAPHVSFMRHGCPTAPGRRGLCQSAGIHQLRPREPASRHRRCWSFLRVPRPR